MQRSSTSTEAPILSKEFSQETSSTGTTTTTTSHKSSGFLDRIRERSEEKKKRRNSRPIPPLPEPTNMDPPKFTQYEQLSALSQRHFGFAQGVAVGNILKISSQGGWDAKGRIHHDIVAQIMQACDNVAAALAKLRHQAGWNYVYAVKTYHTNLDQSLELMAAHLQSRMQKHSPIWNWYEVQTCRLPGMVIEIEVEAYLERAVNSQFGGI